MGEEKEHLEGLIEKSHNVWLGAFGTEIWGDRELAEAINELLKKFEKLFTDDGKMITILKDDWLKIPLVGDWKLVDAKLAHRVYPMGPRERDLVDD